MPFGSRVRQLAQDMPFDSRVRQLAQDMLSCAS
jgi:hypothetical protein